MLWSRRQDANWTVEEEEVTGQPGFSLEGIMTLKCALGESEDKENILNNRTKDSPNSDT
jgi:hypothetical protein